MGISTIIEFNHDVIDELLKRGDISVDMGRFILNVNDDRMSGATRVCTYMRGIGSENQRSIEAMKKPTPTS